MFALKKYIPIALLFFLCACQSENAEQNYNAQETITAAAPLTSYLQRVAMVQTVQDNVIDQSSYCTIKFPYTIKVNNESIAINTPADYQKVWDNINANSYDDDIVVINFPVTMVYYNYIEKFITNEADFNDLLAYWNLYPNLLAKISGIDINYPISINSYDSANQIASTQLISTDEIFFNFLKNLSTSQYISLNYPISVTDYYNHIQLITNNLEFENTIKHAIDNVPYNSNSSLNFNEVLKDGVWRISYFYNKVEKSTTYAGYTFVFKEDYTVVATKAGVDIIGQWETKVVNGHRTFKINFDLEAESLHKLGFNWEIFEFNNSIIHLRDAASTNDTHYLYFEKL